MRRKKAGVQWTAAPPNERFRRIFERTVKACVAAGIAKGEIVHADAVLIRADVAWESLAVRHIEAVATANADTEPGPDAEKPVADAKKTGKLKKVCLTDPDATMATTARNRRLEPSYKQHGVVDDGFGVVLEVEITTGETNEGDQLLARLDAVEATTGVEITTATADAGYAYAKIFGGLERRGIGGVRRAFLPLEGTLILLTPDEGRADPQPRSRAPLPLRRPQRHPEMPARQDPAAWQVDKARMVLPLAAAGLRGLRPRRALPLEGPQVQVGRHRQRLPGASARASPP